MWIPWNIKIKEREELEAHNVCKEKGKRITSVQAGSQARRP